MMSVVESRRFVEDAQDVLNICIQTRSADGEPGTAGAFAVADVDVPCWTINYIAIISVGEVVVLK